MANLTIKGVPASVHRKLKVAAADEGRSLNSLINSILEASTNQADRRRLMRESREEFRRYVSSLPRSKSKSSVELIREDREQGHR
jgi:plasmid stability protein